MRVSRTPPSCWARWTLVVCDLLGCVQTVVSSIVNLVTDSLQRTCTGTVIVKLTGSVWEQGSEGDGGVTGSGTSGDRDQVTAGYSSTSEGLQRVTGSWGNIDGTGSNTDTFQGDLDDNLDTPVYGDNVHFGPAGIGLLIMGFLVLGCKHFSPSFDMFLSKNMAKEIKGLGVQLKSVFLARIF